MLERREQAADLLVSALGQSLVRTEQMLRDAPSKLAQRSGVVEVVANGRIETYPPNALLYYPAADAASEPHANVYANAEELEFRRAEYRDAVPLLEKLAQSPEPRVRAGALIRLARNQRKSGKINDALFTYGRAAVISGATVNGIPADLVAGWARCGLLAEAGRTAELRHEAAALRSHLLRGRWRLSRAAFYLHLEDTDKWLGEGAALPAGAVALTEAAEQMWNEWRDGHGHGATRRAVRSGGIQLTVLSTQDGGEVRALLATPEYAEREWFAKLAPLLQRHRVRLSFGNTSGRRSNESRRTYAETGLPWTIAVESTDVAEELEHIAGRRRLWLISFGLLAVLVAVGAYVVARAVARELEVARLQSDFVSAVSHEFRTPLTVMRQLIEILIEGRVVMEGRRATYYQALGRQTDRLSRLVEGLLDFGRIEAGSTPFKLEPIDACVLVRSVVEQFGREASDRGYAVDLRIDSASAMIAGDREALTHAIWNLLDNAVKYSLDCRTVWVGVERETGRVAIHVHDRGMGIPAQEHNEIFRKFVRGAAAREGNIRGTGIGLAMVSHIVSAHGGEVCVASKPGVGSTFTLRLPVEETCNAS